MRPLVSPFPTALGNPQESLNSMRCSSEHLSTSFNISNELLNLPGSRWWLFQIFSPASLNWDKISSPNWASSYRCRHCLCSKMMEWQLWILFPQDNRIYRHLPKVPTEGRVLGLGLETQDYRIRNQFGHLCNTNDARNIFRAIGLGLIVCTQIVIKYVNFQSLRQKLCQMPYRIIACVLEIIWISAYSVWVNKQSNKNGNVLLFFFKESAYKRSIKPLISCFSLTAPNIWSKFLSPWSILIFWNIFFSAFARISTKIDNLTESMQKFHFQNFPL